MTNKNPIWCFGVLSLQGMPPVWVLQLVGLVLVQITRVLWLRWAIVLMRHVFFGQKNRETFSWWESGCFVWGISCGFLRSSWAAPLQEFYIKQTKFNSGMLKDYWPSCAQEATKYKCGIWRFLPHSISYFGHFLGVQKVNIFFGNPICQSAHLNLEGKGSHHLRLCHWATRWGWFWHKLKRTCKKHVGEVCIVQWFTSIDSIVYHT